MPSRTLFWHIMKQKKYEAGNVQYGCIHLDAPLKTEHSKERNKNVEILKNKHLRANIE